MSYTCEVCGAVTEAKYGSGRFCRSECAKKYSSLKSLEKLRAKQSGKPDDAPRVATREGIDYPIDMTIVPRIDPPTQRELVAEHSKHAGNASTGTMLATSYTAEEQARASRPPYTPTPPTIVNAVMPRTETVNVYVQYQKRARTREQMFKRMDNNMDVIRAEIARQFCPRWDMWRI